MAFEHVADSGRPGARTIPVWDPLVRLIHWSLALTIVANGWLLDGESKIHEVVGFTALGLVAVRLVWGLIGTEHARFTAFPPNPVSAVHHLREMIGGDRSVHLSHNPLGALMVYNIWATVVALGVTGYMMGTPQFFGVDWVEEVHEVAFDWLAISVALHIAGVVFDTLRTRVPIVRAMIDGRKTIPEDRSVK